MKKSKNIKPMPNFKTEDEEREFWDTHDFTDYFDMDHPVKLDLSQLKPSAKSISLRLPEYLLARIQQLANFRDVPYQSLMKIFLAERVEKEMRLQRQN